MIFAVLIGFKFLAFGVLVLKSFKMGFCRERASRLYQDDRSQTSSLSAFMQPLKMPSPQAKTRMIYLINHKAWLWFHFTSEMWFQRYSAPSMWQTRDLSWVPEASGNLAENWDSSFVSWNLNPNPKLFLAVSLFSPECVSSECWPSLTYFVQDLMRSQCKPV